MMGKSYFGIFFKAYQHATIAEVLQISQYFPESISKEDNSDLMEEVLEDKLKANLHSFQTDKAEEQTDGLLNFS